VELLKQRFKVADREEKLELRKNQLIKLLPFHNRIHTRLSRLNKALRLAKKRNNKSRVKQLKARMQQIKRLYNKRFNKIA